MGLMKQLYVVAIEKGYNVNKLNSVVSSGILPGIEEEPKVKEIVDEAWGSGSYEKLKEDIQSGKYQG